ncbi:MAG: MotA/TolQ/ExbB proton channel family protein [Lachnospiraceae bacterium]|nr:MotA/TolQ/ExbB proton channel family protein [Lachnospiraceae bacterium]
MKSKLTYEWILFIVYIGLFAVFVYLNFLKGNPLDMSNLIVNGALFLIVAIIYMSCLTGSFIPLNRMVYDLKRVAEKIRQDAMNSHEFLWEQYGDSPQPLFNEKILWNQFSDYKYELNRIANSKNAYYKCDIEDYINSDLLDSTVHRNMLNQVPGVMTGLGILGTFIGLSLGLENFSTGTTAEITNSISPLMEGIKVAFHTSIYGMIFSLTFNYVFKRKLDEAESAVTAFLVNYKKYVLPDTTTDGINKLMELQEVQTKAINSLSMTVAHQLSQGLEEFLNPQFDRFDQTITKFGMMQTKNQLDALSVVVNSFLDEMNKSMNNSFLALSDTISRAYELQEKNAAQLETVLDKTGGTALKLEEIDKSASGILNSFESYTKDVAGIQGQIGGSIEEINKVMSLMAENTLANENLINEQKSCLKDILEYRKALEASSANLNEQLKAYHDLMSDMKELTMKTPESVDETFKIIDKNLVSVETHFRDTIEQIQDVTDRTANVVSESAEYLEKSFDRASYAVDRLASSVEQLRRDNRR